MNQDVNNVAESSAASAVAEPVQFDGWDDQGTPIVTKKIEPKKQESEPAAAPAKEAQSEPEGKSAAETESAPNQGKKERKPGEKLNREERIAQLTAKVRELEERERSRESAPKPTQETKPEPKAEAPKRPNPFTWKGTPEEYEAALDAWEGHQKQQAILEFQRNQAAERERQNLQRQFDEAKAKYPDAEQRIKATFDSLAKVQLPPVISAMLNDSDCLPDVMYVLADETTRNNFVEMAQKNPGKAIRALTQIERDIETARAAKPTEKAEKSETKPPEEPKPRAPKPPPEVGGRGVAPEDALRQAAATNRFGEFEAEMNRRMFRKAG